VVRTVGRTAVVAGTASAVAGGVHRHQSKKWNEKEQAAANQQQAAYDQGAADAEAAAAPPPPPAPAVDDQTAQIQKLATMHSQGLLTDEEFASAKAKALGI